MILNKTEAYELGNALLVAADSEEDRVVLSVGGGTIIATKPLDDGYDEGYDTIARVISD